MRSGTVSRPLRLAIAGLLLATVASCGSSSDSNRNRNSALECDQIVDGTLPPGCDPSSNGEGQKIECEAQWDPTTKVITFCDSFAKVVVQQKDKKGKSLNEGDVAEVEGGTNAVQVTLLAGATKLEVDVWTLNPAGEARKAGDVEFEADKTATKKFMYMPDADQASATTTTPEVDRELVFGYEQHDVTQSVDTTEAGVGPFTKRTKAELKLEYRLNGAAPESNILSVTLKAYDAAGAVLSSSTKSVDATKGGSDEGDEWSELEASLRGDFMASTARIGIVISGRDGAANSGGQTGPRVTSVELRAGDRTINRNTSFDDGETDWSVVGNSFSRCSLTNGALPCITDAPFESAFTAETPGEETTTTVEETTTTVEETTTTVEETTTMVEETTTTVEETTTTVANDEVTVQTIAPPLLVPREQCSFTWTAQDRKFTACDTFPAMKVAVYGADGRYVGSASSVDSSSVEVPEAMAGAMRYAYYAIGRELQTEQGTLVVAHAREWLTIPDPTKDVSDQILMDSAQNPTLREEGDPTTLEVIPQLDAKTSTVRWTVGSPDVQVQQIVVEVNGSRNVNQVTVPTADSYAIRVYASNEFGFLDYVAGGTTSRADSTVNMQAQVTFPIGLGLLKVNSDTESVALVEPDQFVEGDIEECAGAQPILYTTPNSPSRSNRVTISLDADCSSVNGVLAVAVVRYDLFDEDSDFESSVAWWNVSSTRYSSRMTETIYLPDGKYSIFFFNPDTYFIKGMEYQVDAGRKNDACKEMSLRMDLAKGLGIIEGCDALAGVDVAAAPMGAGTYDSNDESEKIEPDIETSGAAIELDSVPDGWWQLLVIDRQQTVAGGLFAVCVRQCDIPDAPGMSVDSSALTASGTVNVSDSACVAVAGNADSLESPRFSQSLAAFAAPDDEHALRAVWIDPDILNEDEDLNGNFTARFAKPGARALLSTWCGADGTAKNEGDPVQFVSRGLKSIDITGAPTTVPANDRIENAVDITGASEVTLQQFGATTEPDEPLAGLSAFVFDRSLITTTWLKFTAPTTSRIRLSLPELDSPGFDPAITGLTVYRKDGSGPMGFVTSNMTVAQAAWIAMTENYSDIEQSISDLAAQEVNVKAGVTYYVQVVGLSMVQHPSTLLVSSVDAKEWSAADIADILSSTTVTDGEPGVITGPEDSTTTTDAPGGTDDSTTTTEEPQATTTVNAPTSTPEAETTTTLGSVATSQPSGQGSGSDTSVPQQATTTSVVPSVNQKVAEGMLDLIENGSRNETLPVLAGNGVPTVEAREDAISVTIGMADIIASVSKSGAEVSPQSRIIITTERGRHIAVSQKLKSITVPVAGVAATQDVKVTAYSADGKTLTSTITVEKKLAPLVKVDVAGNSPTGRIIAVVLLLVLALAIAIFARKARRSGAAA